jgi:hypothetical protein
MPIEALSTLIMMGALAAILYGPWQTLCTDAARQCHFEIRDKLFDMAADGKLSFESPEYRTIRTSMEQNIRYAHTLTAWRFFALFVHVLRARTDDVSERTRAIQSIKNEEVRKEVDMLSFRGSVVNVLMMVGKSPLIIILLIIAFITFQICKLFGGAADHFTSLFRKAGETIQIEAEGCA